MPLNSRDQTLQLKGFEKWILSQKQMDSRQLLENHSQADKMSLNPRYCVKCHNTHFEAIWPSCF